MRTARRDEGFTISELVLVLAVFAGLVAIAVVSLRGINDDNAAIECRDELRALKAASERFKAELTIYPPDDQALADAGYLELGDTPNYDVVSADGQSPTYTPVGDRCR
jgi:prepilin-type N-terminal cleavage/methylation domain-containing protein